MKTQRKPVLVALLLALSAAISNAATFSGSLADGGNSALVGSDLGGALFDSDADIALNVALYSIVVPTTSFVTIASTGYAAGGVDPYFTLFTGGGLDASFLASNYLQAFNPDGPGGDFTYSGKLAAGTYQIALGTFANLSFAENYSGVPGYDYRLGDGFTGLGEADSLGTSAYSLDVTLVAVAVAEPGAELMLLGGLLVVAGAQARRRRLALARC